MVGFLYLLGLLLLTLAVLD
jgi:hypothetical protein